jgi:DNA-binding NarL/FixJ family response regulator
MNSFLICDDHALVREAISGAILSCWPKAEITEASSFTEAWTRVSDGFDLCICDLSMPGADAVSGVQELKQAAPDMPILIVTGSHDDQMLLKLMDAGVNGFVEKNKGGKVMLAAIHLIAAGERHVPSRILEMANKQDLPLEALIRLTDQQRKVISLVAIGKSNKMIALELGVAPSTIKSHLEQAMRAMGATSRFEAANLARIAGLI